MSARLATDAAWLGMSASRLLQNTRSNSDMLAGERESYVSCLILGDSELVHAHDGAYHTAVIVGLRVGRSAASRLAGSQATE